MAKLLYVEASPRKTLSNSIRVAREFLDNYQRANPEDAIDALDLWKEDLPPFDGDTINAKYRILHGETHTDTEADAWSRVVNLFNRFNAADKYVFSIPMWNFNIPYRFKHFIDVVTQPGLSFSFSPETGYQGLVTGKPALMIYARGGEYSSSEAAGAMDLQKQYVDLWLGFIGFTDVKSILIEPTLAEPAVTDPALTAAIHKAEEIARRF